MDMELSECPRDCGHVLSELRELMEVRVEVKEESTLLGCTELVSEPMDVHLCSCLREDADKVSWQALPVSCAWAVN